MSGAYGSMMFPNLPYFAAGAGVRTPWGTFVPPGGIVNYVRSVGAQDFDPPELASRLYPTLASALADCRSGRGDTCLLLPGHTESVVDATMLASLKPSTRIIGWGRGASMPVFRWTAAAAQWAISVADVEISGLRLRMEGFNGVTKAIAMTGADVVLGGCDIEIASGAAAKAVIGLEVGAGGDRFQFISNKVRGTTDIVTDFLKVVAAVDQIEIVNNRMIAACTAASGLIDITAAATNLLIAGNYISNTAAASTAGINIANVAATGVICDTYCATQNNGVATAQGIILGAACLVRAFQSFSSDEPNKSGILTPTVVAT